VRAPPGCDWLRASAGWLPTAWAENISSGLSEAHLQMRILHRRAVIAMPQLKPFYGGLVLLPAETALALKLVTETDLLRLKAIARLHARGLPADVSWDDLLQEAFARVISGSRRKPQGVTMVVFLSGVMRSLRSEHWRRAQLESRDSYALRRLRDSEASQELEPADPTPDPERSMIAWQEMARINRLFADDPVALQIVLGLAEGLSADEIRKMSGISKTDYDSARRRMRRALLREGLTSCEKK
jgi:DNA-directed RNA polymerase specialized sigma24 family protein